ncbi:L-serine dehydratase [Orenia metallireducens]|jgi:L-serine dehydratase|uniref:L-serine dehydratase n=1 Tax=Orenia metallireducens TaxID=1413210 RepID=A0A285F3A1_9FIRM|nr:L-serine ammonia-lyase, iron-sulfur-dependent, subunit alpha [Orenia metallireducens]PRX34832.1 L-serine dehydratase [Orenia metallireducens]SNY05800.1 L-serine dehydratase [Orenia metallireducens]
MYNFNRLSELIELAKKEQLSIVDIIIGREQELTNKSRGEIRAKMAKALTVMRESVEIGLSEDIKSTSGLSGGDAKLLIEAQKKGATVTGTLLSSAIAKAIAVAEVNAAMGRIVAVPTAGSCGILPGALLAVAEAKDLDDEAIIDGLFVASGIGLIIAKQATVSGAEGGCQAECGSAAAMAAGAIVYMLEGKEEQVLDAVAIALKNVLGLVCDPVAGLVEVPCIKRNAGGATNSLMAAELALAGIKSHIPADEVIIAMKKIGQALAPQLKETSLGGLAVTPTGCKLKDEILSK